MTNTELLEKYIKASGKKKGYLAEKCGLSAAGFWNCCNNKNGAEFKTGHILILCDELGIKTLKERDAVFFAQKVAV